MTTAKRRVEKLESGLTPKQAILLWLQEAHAFRGIKEYVRHLKTQPDSAAPLYKLAYQVEEGVKQSLKGKSKEEIDRAVRQAYKDVLFLFFLHQRVDDKLINEQRYYWSQAMLLSSKLCSLLRERDVEWQMRWNRIRVEMQTPYPLDEETAAAVEAAKQNYVLTWEIIEENDDVGKWLKDGLVAGGKTLLPDGAYLMMGETKESYTEMPTEDDVRELFEDAERFQKFRDEEDYSYGLADVTDAEYIAHYEAIVSAIKSLVQHGTVVDLPTVPHQFLREVPLVDGDWIDRYVFELAEWGARLVGKGFQLEDSKDSHPMAWHRIIDPADGSEVDGAVTMKLWQLTRKCLAAFPGRTRVIDGRPYLSFEDYMKWRGRRNKGDLKSGTRTGLVVAPWNHWLEEQDGVGAVTIAGVKVGKLDCYLEGYRYCVCRNAGELAEEMRQREALLESPQIWEPEGNDGERFRIRLEDWRDLALGLLPEVFTLRSGIYSISQRYFEGQEVLFPSVAEGFDRTFASVKKLVGVYNEDLAEEIERVERLLNKKGDRQRASDLKIDVAELNPNIEKASIGQVAYFVALAKADALELLGETGGAAELMEPYV